MAEEQWLAGGWWSCLYVASGHSDMHSLLFVVSESFSMSHSCRHASVIESRTGTDVTLGFPR